MGETEPQLDEDEEMRVQKYCMGRILGRGAFGTVRLATSPGLSDPVAIKVFNKSLLSRLKSSCSGSSSTTAASSGRCSAGSNESHRRPPICRRGSLSGAASGPTMLTQVCNEIAIMKKFNQRNITRLIEVVDDPAEDRMYIVMEFVDGGVVRFDEARPLEQRLAYARSVFRQLMLALEYMHFHNVCHRDIKPENMLVTREGVLKVTDFGVSVACEGGDDTQQRTAGTPAFLPPEACSGGAYRGKPADVWAAGVSLFLLATGRMPFAAGSMAELYERVAEGRVEYPAGLEPRLRALLERVLEREPERRATVAEIREHAWLTDSGAAPLPAAETEGAAFEATEEERAGAITLLDRLFAISRLKGRARALRTRASRSLRHKRALALGGALGSVVLAARLRDKAARRPDGGEAVEAAARETPPPRRGDALLLSRLASTAGEMAARVRARRVLREEREAARALSYRPAAIAQLQGKAKGLAARARAAVAERRAAEELAAGVLAAVESETAAERAGLLERLTARPAHPPAGAPHGLQGPDAGRAWRGGEGGEGGGASCRSPPPSVRSEGAGSPGSSSSRPRSPPSVRSVRAPRKEDWYVTAQASPARDAPAAPGAAGEGPSASPPPARMRAGLESSDSGDEARRAAALAAAPAEREAPHRRDSPFRPAAGLEGGPASPAARPRSHSLDTPGLEGPRPRLAGLPEPLARWAEAILRIVACCGPDAPHPPAAVPLPPTPRNTRSSSLPAIASAIGAVGPAGDTPTKQELATGLSASL